MSPSDSGRCKLPTLSLTELLLLAFVIAQSFFLARFFVSSLRRALAFGLGSN
jgi:hypothetical protein